MTKLQADWLNTKSHKTLFRLFTDAGFQLFYVGGCVRNALIGTNASDIDMATDATPNQMEALAKPADLPTLPIGKDHGTITFLMGADPIEITTFRSDVETDGRHAQVSFSKDIAQDAARRDFTMNAIYADADGSVLDPVGGLADIKRRRVRFIGDADARILEDHLRILRFFRFHAWYGDPADGLDSDALAACASHADQIENLSRERVGAEMRKLLSAPDPAPSIAAMAQSGVLGQVMQGADPKALAPLVHLEDDTTPNWLRRAAVMGGENVSDTWRLSRKEAKTMALMRDLIGETTSAAEIAYRHSADMAWDVLMLRAAIFEDPEILSQKADISAAANAVFPVRATDLPSDLSGPDIGKTLRSLETRWINSGFTLSKSELLR